MSRSNPVLNVITTEMRDERHEDHVDNVAIYANVRAVDLEENFVPFWTFFDKLVPCIAGVKVWSVKVKIAQTITESGCVTITDEAFTQMALENYWGRWFHQKTAKWTDSRRGNQQYMGWSDVAYDRYDEACKRIKEQRGTPSSRALESKFRTRAQTDYASGRVVSRTNTGKEKQREIFDELEIE